jgi:hypothetical protein
MAKQAFQEVDAGDQAWDAGYAGWHTILSTMPFPLVSFANIAALPAADQHDDGIAVVQANDDTDYVDKMVVVSESPDAIAYKKLAWQTGEVTELTDSTAGTANDTLEAIPDPADTPASADALRDDIVANVLPALRNDLADLAAKVNEILTAMKSAGSMASS